MMYAARRQAKNPRVETMTKFKIKMARIETGRDGGRDDDQVRITFQVERGALCFQLPIQLSAADYDDTEIVQAARAILHRTFVELAAQSLDWERSAMDLQRLSGMSRRPRSRPAKSQQAKSQEGSKSQQTKAAHEKTTLPARRTAAKYSGKTKLSNK
jgi:hypothetical protein